MPKSFQAKTTYCWLREKGGGVTSDGTALVAGGVRVIVGWEVVVGGGGVGVDDGGSVMVSDGGEITWGAAGLGGEVQAANDTKMVIPIMSSTLRMVCRRKRCLISYPRSVCSTVYNDRSAARPK